MHLWHALILGIVEGITEFLPISSTGHLTILEKLLGYKIDNPGITAFTAIIQVGATISTLIYFRKDIMHIVRGWVAGVFHPELRRKATYKFGWAIIVGSIPIAVVGLAFKHKIETGLRSLWIVAIGLIVWGIVMWVADRVGKNNQSRKSASWKDTLVIGIAQCLALIPGVSRSGATISVGLFRGFDRLAATKLSFFLAIPALLAASALEALSNYKDISNGVGWPATIVATVASGIVAYAVIAWLLKFIAHHTYSIFITYRLVLGVVLIILLASHTLSAT